MEMVKREIDVDKIYKFPRSLVTIEFLNKYIIISPDTANWLVLNDEDELKIFNMLKSGNEIQKVYLSFQNDEFQLQKLVEVLTQIEAKKFEALKKKSNGLENICIYLTNNCNLRCPHCYMYSGDRIIKELKTEDWIMVLRIFKECGGKNVTFSGGEVSLREDLEYILKYSDSIGLKNTILTNGVLWDEELINRTYKYIDEIQVSIDGYNEDMNSKVRGKGNFEKALDTIDKFYTNDVRTSIAVTPLYEDIDDFLQEFEYFGKK